jgi:predicted permease
MAASEQFQQDLRYAARTLKQSPGFTSITCLTLILGIGATTALFSVLNAVLLRSLPYPEPGRLVHVLADDPHDSRAGVSWRAFEVLKSDKGPFSHAAAYYRNTGWSRVTMGGTDQPESVQAAFATAGFFGVMGTSPIVGRVFNLAEEHGREPLAVLSSALWQRRFAGDPGAIGRTVDIDGRAFTIIGVMPHTFQFPARETQLWLPITTNRFWDDRPLPDGLHTRGYYMRWNIVGRLLPGADPATVSQSLEPLKHQLASENPDWNMGLPLKAVPLAIELSASARLGLFVLFGSVCLVLLIGCANVANLILARGAARSREFSIRAALGATEARMIRQVLTESLLLVLLSTCGALPLAQAATRILVRYGPPDLPRLDEASIDWTVVIFTLAVSAVAALVSGILPALRAGRSDPNEQLKSGGRTATAGKAATRTGAALIVSEFALAAVLLVACGLLIRSLHTVENIPLGFSPDQVLTAQIRLPDGTDAARKRAFEEQILWRLRSLPGVVSAGGIQSLFELGRPPENSLRAVEGRSLNHSDSSHDARALTWTTVSGEYFQALGIPLLAGRYFSDHDTATSPPVAIIDQAMALRYWPNENPVGKRFKGQDARGANDDWLTVIGVVRNTRRQGLEQEPTPHVYEWHKQADPVTSLVVRAKGEPSKLSGALRSAIRDIDPSAVVSRIVPMSLQIERQTAARRFETWLLSLFAGIAMVLSTIGIYGVLSYATARRTHEIGIRMALGARRISVLAMVLRQGMRLALGGLAVGISTALLFTHILSALLYGVTPTDPLTFVSVSLVLLSVGAGAALLPAWRATRVDPLVTLRSE